MNGTPDKARLLTTAGILLPAVATLCMIFAYNVDVPHWDQWELPPLLEKSLDGTLTFCDFWAQHNEHRLIFPRLVMLAMARLSNWNMFYEYAFSFATAGVLLAFYALQARKREAALWLLPLVSLIIFSPAQWQNWYLGWQLQIFMNIAFVSAGIFVLATDMPTRTRYPIAALCGIVATYSFANGFLFWPITLGQLLLQRRWNCSGNDVQPGACRTRRPESHPDRHPCENRDPEDSSPHRPPSQEHARHSDTCIPIFRERGLSLMANWKNGCPCFSWLLIALAVCASFFYDFTPTRQAPSLATLIRELPTQLVYLCKYLGGPLCYIRHTGPTSATLHNWVALILGATGLIGFFALAVQAKNGDWHKRSEARTKRVACPRFSRLQSALALAAYAILSGALAGIGRLGGGEGTDQALSSRYITIANLFWLALLLLLAQRRSSSLPTRLVACAITALVLISSYYGWLSWSERNPYLEQARAALIAGHDRDLLKRLYPETDILLRRNEILRHHGLSVYR